MYRIVFIYQNFHTDIYQLTNFTYSKQEMISANKTKQNYISECGSIFSYVGLTIIQN